MFALIHLRIFRPTITAHTTCVFPSLADDTHIVGLASDVLPFIIIIIIGGVWHIKTFNAINEVCCLVSIGVKLVYIISSIFFTFEFGICILSAIVGFLPFAKSFIS